MVTNGEGRKQKLIFRYRAPFDADAAAGAGGGGRGGGAGAGNASAISTTKPMTLTTTNAETRASGFYRTSFTAPPRGEDFHDRQADLVAPQRRKNADVMVFTEQKFEESPTSGSPTRSSRIRRRCRNANPQQAEFRLGQGQRDIKYINGDGKVLTARPHQGRTTSIRRRSIRWWSTSTRSCRTPCTEYAAPNVGTNISLTRYVSNGYVVPSRTSCTRPATPVRAR